MAVGLIFKAHIRRHVRLPHKITHASANNQESKGIIKDLMDKLEPVLSEEMALEYRDDFLRFCEVPEHDSLRRVDDTPMRFFEPTLPTIKVDIPAGVLMASLDEYRRFFQSAMRKVEGKVSRLLETCPEAKFRSEANEFVMPAVEGDKGYVSAERAETSIGSTLREFSEFIRARAMNLIEEWTKCESKDKI